MAGKILSSKYNMYGVMPITGGNGSGAAFDGTSTATLLATLTDDSDRRMCTIMATQDCYVLQAGTATDTVSSSTGAFLKANTYVPILVEDGADYLAVIRSTTDGTWYRWDHQ